MKSKAQTGEVAACVQIFGTHVCDSSSPRPPIVTSICALLFYHRILQNLTWINDYRGSYKIDPVTTQIKIRCSYHIILEYRVASNVWMLIKMGLCIVLDERRLEHYWLLGQIPSDSSLPHKFVKWPDLKIRTTLPFPAIQVWLTRRKWSVLSRSAFFPWLPVRKKKRVQLCLDILEIG